GPGLGTTAPSVGRPESKPRTRSARLIVAFRVENSREKRLSCSQGTVRGSSHAKNDFDGFVRGASNNLPLPAMACCSRGPYRSELTLLRRWPLPSRGRASTCFMSGLPSPALSDSRVQPPSLPIPSPTALDRPPRRLRSPGRHTRLHTSAADTH